MIGEMLTDTGKPELTTRLCGPHIPHDLPCDLTQTSNAI